MKVVAIDKHLEKRLIELGIERDRWSAIVNAALSEKLKKEVRWHNTDGYGCYRGEFENNGNDGILKTCESIIEQVEKVKSEVEGMEALPKRYFCMLCGCYHTMPDNFIPHLIYKGEPPEELNEYYEILKKERHLHRKINAHKGLLRRAMQRNDEEKIKYHREKIEELIPKWKEINEKLHRCKKYNRN